MRGKKSARAGQPISNSLLGCHDNSFYIRNDKRISLIVGRDLLEYEMHGPIEDKI
jgi:hypothetical protein